MKSQVMGRLSFYLFVTLFPGTAGRDTPTEGEFEKGQKKVARQEWPGQETCPPSRGSCPLNPEAEHAPHPSQTPPGKLSIMSLLRFLHDAVGVAYWGPDAEQASRQERVF